MRIKLLCLVVVIAFCLSGCVVYNDETQIFIVEEIMATESGAIASFDRFGKRETQEFLDEDIYPCEESSRVISIGSFDNSGGWWHLYDYLYLDAEDYAKFIEERYGMDEGYFQKGDRQ